MPDAQSPRAIAYSALPIGLASALRWVLAGLRRGSPCAPLGSAHRHDWWVIGSGRSMLLAALRRVLAEYRALELGGAGVAFALRREDLACVR